MQDKAVEVWKGSPPGTFQRDDLALDLAGAVAVMHNVEALKCLEKQRPVRRSTARRDPCHGGPEQRGARHHRYASSSHDVPPCRTDSGLNCRSGGGNRSQGRAAWKVRPGWTPTRTPSRHTARWRSSSRSGWCPPRSGQPAGTLLANVREGVDHCRAVLPQYGRWKGTPACGRV
jgi:hypothetical protein